MSTSILIIDDDASSRSLMAEFLSDAGYDVTTAESYAEGLSSGTRETFEFVIVDMNLPDGEGLDLLIEIKKKNPTVKAIVLSGMESEDIYHEAEKRKLTIQHTVTKPFSLMAMLKIIQNT